MYGPNNGTGSKTYMDIDTGDMTIVTEYPGANNGSVIHVPNKKKK